MRVVGCPNIWVVGLREACVAPGWAARWAYTAAWWVRWLTHFRGGGEDGPYTGAMGEVAYLRGAVRGDDPLARAVGWACSAVGWACLGGGVGGLRTRAVGWGWLVGASGGGVGDQVGEDFA
ncbi:hypothetical protein Ahu01nite_032010 [Winogradskya humida]|uniref:Uncharacterized protein n=1 Tax=Winogradskya humida TaxID=113566 RepID=A0ABQ3ZNM6_9ACTN|nr:hypothetical protein Ahu01nite_032010 [Actinoplanes humidus]